MEIFGFSVSLYATAFSTSLTLYEPMLVEVHLDGTQSEVIRAA